MIRFHLGQRGIKIDEIYVILYLTRLYYLQKNRLFFHKLNLNIFLLLNRLVLH